MKRFIPGCLSIVFILLFLGGFGNTYAQNSRNAANDAESLVVFDSIAAHIEKKGNIQFYYKPEWFRNKVFIKSIADLPLDECLTIVKRLTDLNCIAVNPTSYVFVPVQVRNFSNRTDRKGVLIIGEESDFGRFTRATISGKVLDLKTGKPLRNASLSIEKLNVRTTTDKNGNYSLTIPTGESVVWLNYPGYEENTKSIRVGGNGIVNFELSDKSILLQEVVILDKALDLNIIKTQMSSIKLNSKTIKELPNFLGEKDIIKSVTLLPGIQSTGEFGTGFFVRGGSLDQNLILVEDVPLFNSSHVFGLNSAINPDGVKNVTLLKGGIPARYGERASSVMDIRLNDNADKLQFKGGVGLLDSRLNLETPLFNKKVNLLVGGRISYSDWLLHAMPDVDLKNSSADFYDLNALITVRMNPKNSLSFFGYTSNDDFRFVKTKMYQYDNSLFSAHYNHTFNDKLSSVFSMGWSRYRSTISESDSLKPNDAYKIRFSTGYYDGKINFNWQPSDKHSIDFGLNSIVYDLQPGAVSPFDSLSTVITQNSNHEKGLELAEYISDNINFSPDLSAEIGLRVSHFAYLGPNSLYTFNDNTPHNFQNIADTVSYGNNTIIKWYTGLEPRISLRYSLNKLSSLKLSYNRISQYINLISNTAVMSPTDVYKLSSPNVKPLICNQLAVGYFQNFNDNAIEASVEMYYKKLDNIIEYRDGASIVMNNTLEADLLNASGYNYGMEFYLRKNTGKLTGWLSYTFSRSLRHTTSTYEADQINGNKYFSSSFDIPHNLVVNASYHLARRWRLAMLFNYSTGKPITLPELKYTYDGKQYVYYSERNKYRLPDYNRLDIAITYDETLRKKQLWKGSWTLSILNVYGQKNPYSAFYKYSTQLDSQLFGSFNLYNLFIIERPIPTLTYNFSF